MATQRPLDEPRWPVEQTIAAMPSPPAGPTDPVERLALLEAIVEALPVGVAVHDREGRPILVNSALTAEALCVQAGEGAVDHACPAQDAVAVARRAGITRPAVARTEIDVARRSYVLSTSVDQAERRKVEDELLRRAFLDELTGLPNRGLLKQYFAELCDKFGSRGSFALAFIDIDSFKHINDYYSHDIGDELLVRIADRMSETLRPSDMLARLGGDEFVLLLSPAEDAAAVERHLRLCVESLRQPFIIDGHEIFSSASIGISLYPHHGVSYDTLLRNADIAMYHVKNGSKGGMAIFDDTMSHKASARMKTEQRLRLAIRDRRFCCAYQPKFDVRSREITGVEVLLRWRDEQGLIRPPGDFIGLAVELGLINDITRLVLRETMAAIDQIDDVFGAGGTISLNVAAKQAEDVAFMASYAEAIFETGQAERVMLELTEEAFFAKNKFQTEVLPLLRSIGTRVSIDDFGVGYSSLSALADITADEIKVDRSFITDIHKRPRSQIILKAIESLGSALGMSVIAEGIETFEELTYLQAATQIRYAQGYYFARPLFLEQLVSTRTSAAGMARPEPVLRERSRTRAGQGRG